MFIFKDKTKVLPFIKTGIIVLALFLTIGGAAKLASGITGAVAATEKKLPIYCVKTDEKKVSISFDAAWGNDDTAKILEVLKKYNVKATFFMTGEWIGKYPDDVKAIAAAGHDLGNHSENHKQMSTLTAEKCKEEIEKAHAKVKALTGTDMTLFRPPYGDYNNTLIEAVKDSGYHCIQWDVDIQDIKVKMV